MIDILKVNNDILMVIIEAMNKTSKNLKDDFKSIISKSNDNGLYQAVWAFRSDVLRENLPKSDAIVISNNRRVWQTDYVLDKNDGTLFVLIRKDNLHRIISKFNKGRYSHYLPSLLSINSGINAHPTQLELPLMTNEFHMNERKSDANKILGQYGEKVKRVLVCSCSYVKHELNDGNLILYNDNFEIVDELNLQDMIDREAEESTPLSMDVDNNNDDEFVEKPLVSLKKDKLK